MRRELGPKTPVAGFAKAQVLAGAALICGFTGVVAWFGAIDFYHRHFFDNGPIVAADNVVRIVFVIIFSCSIYAPGGCRDCDVGGASCEFRFIKLSGWRRLPAMTSSQWPPPFLAKNY